MQKLLYKYVILWLGLSFMSGCEEPYLPHVLESPNSFLVVNGFINASGTTSIDLSYTQSIYDDAAPVKEVGALVEIEVENGPTIPLIGAGDGVYSASDLDLIPGSKCRLKISTSLGKAYVSDFVEVKASPPIADLSWKAENDGIQIAVSTRDPQNDTRYYSWEAEETWEIRTPYRSFLEYKDGVITYNPLMEDISLCWNTQPVRNILVGTSAKLSQDVINEQPVLKVPLHSNKMAFKYSVNVRQYAQTKEGYEYLFNLKRNTENIGTLFDPQPSQLSGNIRCVTNPSEPVVGFLSASTVEEKRLFIIYRDLPVNYWSLPRVNCPVDTVSVEETPEYLNQGSRMLAGAYYNPGLLGYFLAERRCVDCRLMGTNVRPSFWE